MNTTHIAVVNTEYLLVPKDKMHHIKGIIETLLRFSCNVVIVSIRVCMQDLQMD